jgi:hypothetical protein
MKQETLEEAFNLFKEDYTILHKYNLHHLLQVARFGARWQAKRMYSEEDLFKILIDFVAFPHDHMEPRGSIIERYLKELKNK